MTEVNIILDILKQMLIIKPDSDFIKSLYDQYCNRGGLSKKQLEGLHSKASKVNDFPPGKLATLQAIINKKPTRYKSTIEIKTPEREKDETTGPLIEAILEKYPQHKRVLFLKGKLNNREPLSPVEIAEIEKFSKLLLK